MSLLLLFLWALKMRFEETIKKLVTSTNDDSFALFLASANCKKHLGKESSSIESFRTD